MLGKSRSNAALLSGAKRVPTKPREGEVRQHETTRTPGKKAIASHYMFPTEASKYRTFESAKSPDSVAMFATPMSAVRDVTTGTGTTPAKKITPTATPTRPKYQSPSRANRGNTTVAVNGYSPSPRRASHVPTALEFRTPARDSSSPFPTNLPLSAAKSSTTFPMNVGSPAHEGRLTTPSRTRSGPSTPSSSAMNKRASSAPRTPGTSSSPFHAPAAPAAAQTTPAKTSNVENQQSQSSRIPRPTSSSSSLKRSVSTNQIIRRSPSILTTLGTGSSSITYYPNVDLAPNSTAVDPAAAEPPGSSASASLKNKMESHPGSIRKNKIESNYLLNEKENLPPPPPPSSQKKQLKQPAGAAAAAGLGNENPLNDGRQRATPRKELAVSKKSARPSTPSKHATVAQAAAAVGRRLQPVAIAAAAAAADDRGAATKEMKQKEKGREGIDTKDINDDGNNQHQMTPKRRSAAAGGVVGAKTAGEERVKVSVSTSAGAKKATTPRPSSSTGPSATATATASATTAATAAVPGLERKKSSASSATAVNAAAVVGIRVDHQRPLSSTLTLPLPAATATTATALLSPSDRDHGKIRAGTAAHQQRPKSAPVSVHTPSVSVHTPMSKGVENADNKDSNYSSSSRKKMVMNIKEKAAKQLQLVSVGDRHPRPHPRPRLTAADLSTTAAPATATVATSTGSTTGVSAPGATRSASGAWPGAWPGPVKSVSLFAESTCFSSSSSPSSSPSASYEEDRLTTPVKSRGGAASSGTTAMAAGYGQQQHEELTPSQHQHDLTPSQHQHELTPSQHRHQHELAPSQHQHELTPSQHRQQREDLKQQQLLLLSTPDRDFVGGDISPVTRYRRNHTATAATTATNATAGGGIRWDAYDDADVVAEDEVEVEEEVEEDTQGVYVESAYMEGDSSFNTLVSDCTMSTVDMDAFVFALRPPVGFADPLSFPMTTEAHKRGTTGGSTAASTGAVGGSWSMRSLSGSIIPIHTSTEHVPLAVQTAAASSRGAARHKEEKEGVQQEEEGVQERDVSRQEEDITVTYASEPPLEHTVLDGRDGDQEQGHTAETSEDDEEGLGQDYTGDMDENSSVVTTETNETSFLNRAFVANHSSSCSMISHSCSASISFANSELNTAFLPSDNSSSCIYPLGDENMVFSLSQSLSQLQFLSPRMNNNSNTASFAYSPRLAAAAAPEVGQGGLEIEPLPLSQSRSQSQFLSLSLSESQFESEYHIPEIATLSLPLSPSSPSHPPASAISPTLPVFTNVLAASLGGTAVRRYSSQTHQAKQANLQSLELASATQLPTLLGEGQLLTACAPQSMSLEFVSSSISNTGGNTRAPFSATYDNSLDLDDVGMMSISAISGIGPESVETTATTTLLLSRQPSWASSTYMMAAGVSTSTLNKAMIASPTSSSTSSSTSDIEYENEDVDALSAVTVAPAVALAVPVVESLVDAAGGGEENNEEGQPEEEIAADVPGDKSWWDCRSHHDDGCDDGADDGFALAAATTSRDYGCCSISASAIEHVADDDDDDDDVGKDKSPSAEYLSVSASLSLSMLGSLSRDCWATAATGGHTTGATATTATATPATAGAPVSPSSHSSHTHHRYSKQQQAGAGEHCAEHSREYSSLDSDSDDENEDQGYAHDSINGNDDDGDNRNRVLMVRTPSRHMIAEIGGGDDGDDDLLVRELSSTEAGVDTGRDGSAHSTTIFPAEYGVCDSADIDLSRMDRERQRQQGIDPVARQLSMMDSTSSSVTASITGTTVAAGDLVRTDRDTATVTQGVSHPIGRHGFGNRDDDDCDPLVSSIDANPFSRLLLTGERNCML